MLDVVPSRTIDLPCKVQRTSLTTEEELHSASIANTLISLLQMHCHPCVRTLCWSWCHSALQTPCVCESILHFALLACRYLCQRVKTTSRIVNGVRKFHPLNFVEISFKSSFSKVLVREDTDRWYSLAALCSCKQGMSNSAF